MPLFDFILLYLRFTPHFCGHTTHGRCITPAPPLPQHTYPVYLTVTHVTLPCPLLLVLLVNPTYHAQVLYLPYTVRIVHIAFTPHAYPTRTHWLLPSHCLPRSPPRYVLHAFTLDMTRLLVPRLQGCYTLRCRCHTSGSGTHFLVALPRCLPVGLGLLPPPPHYPLPAHVCVAV